jgi:hypothetical protein
LGDALPTYWNGTTANCVESTRVVNRSIRSRTGGSIAPMNSTRRRPVAQTHARALNGRRTARAVSDSPEWPIADESAALNVRASG